LDFGKVFYKYNNYIPLLINNSKSSTKVFESLEDLGCLMSHGGIGWGLRVRIKKKNIEKIFIRKYNYNKLILLLLIKINI